MKTTYTEKSESPFEPVVDCFLILVAICFGVFVGIGLPIVIPILVLCGALSVDQFVNIGLAFVGLFVACQCIGGILNSLPRS